MKIKPFSQVSPAEIDRLKREGKLKDQPAWRHNRGDVFFECTRFDFKQQLHRVWICDDNGTPLYDTFLHHEPLAAVTLPINVDGQIGLQVNVRPIFRNGVPQTFPELDFNKLGDGSLEAPRGAPKKGESGAQTSARETEEELGKKVRSTRQICWWRSNSTFDPQKHSVHLALVDHRAPSELSPDVNEKILKVDWLDEDAVIEKILAGEISCGATNTALAWYFAKRLKEEKAKTKSSVSGDGQSGRAKSSSASAAAAALGIFAGLANLDDGGE